MFKASQTNSRYSVLLNSTFSTFNVVDGFKDEVWLLFKINHIPFLFFSGCWTSHNICDGCKWWKAWIPKHACNHRCVGSKINWCLSFSFITKRDSYLIMWSHKCELVFVLFAKFRQLNLVEVSIKWRLWTETRGLEAQLPTISRYDSWAKLMLICMTNSMYRWISFLVSIIYISLYIRICSFACMWWCYFEGRDYITITLESGTERLEGCFGIGWWVVLVCTLGYLHYRTAGPNVTDRDECEAFTCDYTSILQSATSIITWGLAHSNRQIQRC